MGRQRVADSVRSGPDVGATRTSQAYIVSAGRIRIDTAIVAPASTGSPSSIGKKIGRRLMRSTDKGELVIVTPGESRATNHQIGRAHV